MKKILAILPIFIFLCIGAGLKTALAKDSIIIYTSMEDYAVELLQDKLNTKFPKYNIKFVVNSTSNIATKVIEEGRNCEADIVFGLENAYIEKIIENDCAYCFGERYDMSIFEEDILSETTKQYAVPSCRSGVSVIVNTKVLAKKGVQIPTSYKDLVDSQYQNLISMPSPASSGTGYAFYLAIMNLLGEEKGLEYFNKFQKNVIAFTTSGSAPVNNLVLKEAGIGIGMISQAVEKINSGEDNLKVLLMEEGAAFGLYSSFIVNGKQTKSANIEILDYLYSEFTEICCEKYYPEKIFKDKNFSAENYPENLFYCDMSNNTLKRKESLLGKWKYV